MAKRQPSSRKTPAGRPSGRPTGRNQISKSGNKQRTGNIRIISGRWRGRKLPVHDVEGLRPTTDRVKETLFNWLMNALPHSRCLDVFTGSGSLAFEALSRGADTVRMLEKDDKAATQLKQNLALLGIETEGELKQTDSVRYLAQAADSPFDVVFLDPPFRKNLLSECAKLLEANGWLTADAMIYVETETELGEPSVPANWRLEKEKTAGQVSYRLYQRS